MPDKRIAHYRILRRLGAGGMGEVFLAEDTELERSVALKVMSAELARDPNQRKRFRSEAKAASGLVHPNICVIHEVGETEDERPFLAMEYIEGETLDKILPRRRMRIREVLDVGIELAEALETAHARHIVHRDIKPSNIMLDQRGHAKILDFGLAKRFLADELGTSTTSLPHTRTGMLIGTPNYMSPEQALGRDVDHRADLFSLGSVLYEMVVGQKAFLGSTVGEVINNVVNLKPEGLGLENPLFSPRLDEIIFKCLEKDPEKRYGSAGAVAEDLRKLKVAAQQAAATARVTAPQIPAPVQPQAAPDMPRPAASRRYALIVGVSVMIVGLTAALALLLLRHSREAAARARSSAGAQPKSVAVLPFDNFSAEADTDYLSDGLTEEITTALSRIHGLKVAARNSAFSFKGRKVDARQVGEALKVSTLLEGSIRKVGRQIRVTAQLINVADGFHLWSETYDRSVDDLFTVQQDIARRIAERLQGKQAPASVAERSVDPEAHKLYLQARLFWNKRTEAGLKRAVQLFQQAIEKDASYAAAHAGLAATYVVMPIFSKDAHTKEFLALARASANRALELDSTCAEAHAVLGNLQFQARDYPGAEKHFQTALQLAPNYATAHHWYGRYLNIRGRWDEGLVELRKAIDLDPLSPIIRSTIPEWHYLQGDFKRAIEESRKVIEVFSDFPVVRGFLAAALAQGGQYEEALKELDQARALQPDDPQVHLEMRGYILARLGREEEARKILARFEEKKAKGESVDGQIGFVCLGLREYDKAMDAFEVIISKGDLDESWALDPFLKECEDLPRFQALVKRIASQQ